jgi:hypothetical protein
MRRRLFTAGIVVALLLLAALGAAISTVRHIRSLVANPSSIALERSTAR